MIITRLSGNQLKFVLEDYISRQNSSCVLVVYTCLNPTDDDVVLAVSNFQMVFQMCYFFMRCTSHLMHLVGYSIFYNALSAVL